jgi:hypothetical protein
VIAALLALGGTAVAQQPGTGETPPPAVVVERIEVQEVSDPSEFNARVEAIESVDIRARVQGFLQTVAFEAGETVQPATLCSRSSRTSTKRQLPRPAPRSRAPKRPERMRNAPLPASRSCSNARRRPGCSRRSPRRFRYCCRRG